MEVTGEEDLSEVRDLEIIFNDVNYIGSLDLTPNLRSLTRACVVALLTFVPALQLHECASR